MDRVDVGLLATAPGIAIVVALIVNILRPAIPADVLDRYGPIIAAALGVVLALLWAFLVDPAPVTGEEIVTAILAGLAGGYWSQNVNSAIQRAAGNTPTGT